MLAWHWKIPCSDVKQQTRDLLPVGITVPGLDSSPLLTLTSSKLDYTSKDPAS